jgi:hypothetical protein
MTASIMSSSTPRITGPTSFKAAVLVMVLS